MSKDKDKDNDCANEIIEGSRSLAAVIVDDNNDYDSDNDSDNDNDNK